jgi:hypothetical protein
MTEWLGGLVTNGLFGVMMSLLLALSLFFFARTKLE